MDPAKPLSDEELEFLRNNPELEGIIPQVMVRRLLATIQLNRVQLGDAKFALDDLRGVGCGAHNDRPCGTCFKCYRKSTQMLQRAKKVLEYYATTDLANPKFANGILEQMKELLWL